MTMPEPQIDCWDYTFDKDSGDFVWIARPNGKTHTATCYTTGGFWQYIMIADTEAEIRESVHELAEAENLLDEIKDLDYVAVPLADVLSNWRFMRYKGRNICAFDTADMTPVSCQSFPDGPPAPVRNGFIYLCYNRATGKPYGTEIKDSVIPHAEPTISCIVAAICNRTGMNVEDVLINSTIVAANLMTASMEHPLILWRGDLFPLHELMLLNPNHNPNDAEESLLEKFD
jgi:hypothetical protein